MKLLIALFLPFWVVNSNSLNPVGSDPCHINAWVRAPDLDPGQIIPGQVRIKANGTCDPISEYSLILRFKERAWVKLPKPDIALPQEPEVRGAYKNISKIDRNSVFRSLHHLHYADPLWGKYTEDMSDPSLWDVIEEERVAFESRYRLNEDITPGFSLREGLTHDFALLVPTTNYPPTSPRDNFVFSAINQGDTAEKGDEHTYLYTVEIKFDNGTTIEVPAGYTTFKPAGRNDNPGPEVMTANFTQIFSSSNDLNVSLIINITFPNGRTLEQGSTYNLTFTLCDQTLVSSDAHGTNYSLALGTPNTNIRTSSHDRWLHTLSPMKNYTMLSQAFLSCQLSPTSSFSEQADVCGYGARLENEAGISSWNVSTSKSLRIAPKAFPSFDMHYGSFESELSISIPIARLEKIENQTRIFDEDYYWVPTTVAEKENKLFPFLTTQIPITISPNVKPGVPVAHYLSSHPRRPLFIDQSTIERLSQLSVEERDLLAPKTAPIIKRNTDNVVRRRYHDKSLHYVGDTWHRKVLNGVSHSDPSDRDGSLNTLLVQVTRN